MLTTKFITVMRNHFPEAALFVVYDGNYVVGTFVSFMNDSEMNYHLKRKALRPSSFLPRYL